MTAPLKVQFCFDEARDVRFDLLGDFRVRRRAVAGREFQALIFRGIVAGGHVDAADRLCACESCEQ